MRDTIVDKAFEQYLIDGYEKVTISTLQKSLGIGRATMYYYFKDKEELFEEVMRKYFLEVINDSLDKVTEDTDVVQLIDINAAAFERISISISKFNNPAISFSSYTGILFCAFSHDLKLAKQILEVRGRIHEAWCAAFRKSIEKGDVKEDIDVNTMANTFESLKGVFSDSLSDEANLKKALESYKKSHLELYKLLKK
ncbi:MAG: TetR/AcrR family transcriptional regulator [Paludibacteraceae bacterium]|nr:TetR/AcrR family transcriptional regulator [Paludibacteraceae bacterium]